MSSQGSHDDIALPGPVLTRAYPEFRRRLVNHLRGYDVHGTLSSLRIFKPFSSGRPKDILSLTFDSANQTLPLLSTLGKACGQNVLDPMSVEDFVSAQPACDDPGELKRLLDRHGSDKANLHDYDRVYEVLLGRGDEIRTVFEIGLGSNNTDVVSNMGQAGRPGASLRAFRDYLPNARIFGADIDHRILFEEDRIRTFQVDQTSRKSLLRIDDEIEDAVDLFIDDGLHSPHANISVLIYGLQKIRAGGWIVIEDISPESASVWQVVSALVPTSQFRTHFIDARGGMMFLANRVQDPT